MAIIYGDGKAGQYAKRTAFQKTTRIFQYSMGGMLAAGIFLGFVLGANFQWRFGLSHWPILLIWPVVGLEAAIGVAVLWGFGRLDQITEKLAKDRIAWLRGGQGEALVAWYLNDLPNIWHVFHNVQLWEKGDLDHVLVGPGGLFCISTKTYRGLYTVRQGGGYQLNGEDIDHIHEAQRLAMQLKDRLAGVLDKVPWIQAVLIAPVSHIGFQTYQSRAWVLHEKNLPDVFLEAPKKMDTAEIERCVKAMKMIADGPAEPARA